MNVPSFDLIADDATAERVLQRIRAHLDPAGAALVPLFVPEPVTDHQVGLVRGHVDEQGRTLRVSATSTDRDESARRDLVRRRAVPIGRTASLSEPPRRNLGAGAPRVA